MVDADRPRLVLATANLGKIAELAALLGDRYQVEARPVDLAETVEDGDTLEANARKKATEVAVHAGAMALADDTGLFVDALDGRPGVHSARYAGPEGDAGANLAKLLDEMAPVAAAARTARFRTVIAVAWPDGREMLVEGSVEGTVLAEPRGGGGFGYDPVFAPRRGRRPHVRRDGARREEPHQPPGPSRCRHRGPTRGAVAAVRTGGLEPPHPLGRQDLNLVRLPVPPRPQRSADRPGTVHRTPTLTGNLGVL